MSIEKSRDELFTSEIPIQVCMLFKRHVQGTLFDSNCVEMGVEAVEMDWEDGKLQNDIRLVSTERSRDELFTSEQRMLTTCSLQIHECWCKCYGFQCSWNMFFEQLVRTFNRFCAVKSTAEILFELADSFSRSNWQLSNWQWIGRQLQLGKTLST